MLVPSPLHVSRDDAHAGSGVSLMRTQPLTAWRHTTAPARLSRRPATASAPPPPAPSSALAPPAANRLAPPAAIAACTPPLAPPLRSHRRSPRFPPACGT